MTKLHEAKEIIDEVPWHPGFEYAIEQLVATTPFSLDVNKFMDTMIHGTAIDMLLLLAESHVDTREELEDYILDAAEESRNKYIDWYSDADYDDYREGEDLQGLTITYEPEE